MGASAGSRRTLEVGGREVSVSNPGKVIFPGADGRADITKSDLVDYYLAVADGALRGVHNRPMILKRFVKGIDEEAIFQKRAPEKRPDFIDVAELRYASGTSAKEAVITEAADADGRLTWHRRPRPSPGSSRASGTPCRCRSCTSSACWPRTT